jgi:hypothetical protein
MNDPQLSDALDAIERYEARFLAWGILDRSLSIGDIETLLSPIVTDEVSVVLREMIRQRLIFEVPRTSPAVYRSRMAEGVRLFAHLRQLFFGQTWEDAPHLVADFRFMVRPRRFPIRALGVDEIVERLQLSQVSSKSLDALRAILHSDASEGPRKLSRFQVLATERVLLGVQAKHDQACIVTAGTGSGKTLAFYLPSLMYLADQDQKIKGTKVLALYPRTELLKDQLLATLRETRRLKKFGSGKASVSIGAYYGGTPFDAVSAPPKYLGWINSMSLQGVICPFLVCPGEPGESDCGGRLVWKETDRKAGKERLHCEHETSCGVVIEAGEFTFIRKSMQSNPPDILFTTTEMLNREMSNSWTQHIFGVGRGAKVSPRVVLLDEAHTYTGSNGAQVAFLLRRWRRLVAAPVMWVGLSATLNNAETFFSMLTGVNSDFVYRVEPESEDMSSRGHEYQLILRGDPASQAALLSTSIQALMLLLRLQDPLSSAEWSSGMLGSKVFAFCDDLDVINRLYRQVLSAEGRTPIGGVNPKQGGSLALIRSPNVNQVQADWDYRRRDLEGQNWWMIDAIRQSRTPPVIGRTSSQDSGVTAQAETVVATASLEVGYDDPLVGAVLQHKAPRDLAQFVQRRGRAGRQQMMRPWTVVVLSDYGRDRLAYQSYEQLFDPSLPPKSLPLANRSIQRMQATFALVDWLALRLSTKFTSKGSVRRDVSGPSVNSGTRERQILELDLLKSVLSDEVIRRDLAKFLRDSLALSADDVDVLMWEGPRSILLEVIPTIIRRLDSSWHVVKDEAAIPNGDRSRSDHPLPEFVPGQLFGDLCLPEVGIVAPQGYDEAANNEEPILLAFSEFAPGNATFRYAVNKTRGLWIDPRTVAESGDLDIAESLLKDSEVISSVQVGEQLIDVMRPFLISPSVLPGQVSTSSVGRLSWDVRMQPEASSFRAVLPDKSEWKPVVESFEFLLKAGTGGVKVLRYSTEGIADIGVPQSGPSRIRYKFANGSDRVAVGVELDVDGLLLRIRCPANFSDFKLELDKKRFLQLRRDRFLNRVKIEFESFDDINPFLAAWLGELTLSAIALDGRWSAGKSVSELGWDRGDWQQLLVEAFDRSFRGLREGVDGEAQSPLRVGVETALQKPQVVEALVRALEDASTPTESWYGWLRQRFITTVASAIHTAIQSLLPEFSADDDLTVDILDDGSSSTGEVWLTENTVGGGGILEAFFTVYSEDPRRFWNLVTGSLEPGDIEGSALGLHRVVRYLAEGRLEYPALQFRGSTGVESIAKWQSLLEEVAKCGAFPSHTLSVAMSTRLFRQGSSHETDLISADALREWSMLEQKIGFAIDQRTACGLLCKNANFVARLASAVADEGKGEDGWAFGVLLSILWTSPESVRAQALRAPMRYSRDIVDTERTLVLDRIDTVGHRIAVTSETWRIEADGRLSIGGDCVLISPVGDEHLLKQAILEMMATPIEVGALFSHPKLVGLRRRMDVLEATLSLEDAPQ